MIAVAVIGADVIDHHSLATIPHFFAQGSGDIELAADAKTKIETVEHRTGGPRVPRDPGHANKSQTGDFSHRSDDIA